MSPSLERYLVVLALALLAGATLAQFLPRASSDVRERAGRRLLTVVVLILGAAIGGRWVRESQGPFLTMYDVLLSNIFSLAVVFLVASRVSQIAPAVSRLVIPLLLIMSIWLSMVSPEAVPLPATFDNAWLWVHVLSGKVFLGLCMVCAAAAMQRLASPGGGPVDDESPIWSMYFIAFISHSVMLVAGSAWAHTAWGRYWSWDTLETSTLVTWLLIGGTLHARVTFRSMPSRVALSLVVVSFVLAFLTFFGLPFLSIGPHKGFI